MTRFVLVWLLATCLLLTPASAQGDTALRLVVLDSANNLVTGLHITLTMEDGSQRSLQTDVHGSAFVRNIPGTVFWVSKASKSGAALRIEGTMVDGSLRLGLVPGQELTILLRLDGDLLAVDPETLFAGTEVPPSVATIDALRPSDPPAPTASRTATRASATASPTSSPTASATASPIAPTPTTIQAMPASAAQPDAPSESRWPMGVAMFLLIAAPCSFLALRGIVRARRGAER